MCWALTCHATGLNLPLYNSISDQIWWHTIFMVMTMIVVARGVKAEIAPLDHRDAAVGDVEGAAHLGEFRGPARRALIYSKGPYAFHILRETFGDEKFFRYLKDPGGGN